MKEVSESNELSLVFLCPIGRAPMKDPVVASDGVSYERANIERWINQQKVTGQVKSPATGEPLQDYTLRPNITLRSAIVTYQDDSENTAPEINHGSSRTNFFRNREQVESLLQKHLVAACKEGNLAIVKIQLEKGANPDLPDDKGQYPLAAAYWGLNESVIELMEQHCQMDTESLQRYFHYNLSTYGSLLPCFKDSSGLTLGDLCAGYLNEQGRDAVFKPWVWESLSKCIYFWSAVDLSDEPGAVGAFAVTKYGKRWFFDASDTKLSDCTNQDAERSVVWMTMIVQYDRVKSIRESLYLRLSKILDIESLENSQKCMITL